MLFTAFLLALILQLPGLTTDPTSCVWAIKWERTWHTHRFCPDKKQQLGEDTHSSPEAFKHSQVPQFIHCSDDQPQKYMHKSSQIHLTLWPAKSLILSGKPALHCTATATKMSATPGLWQLSCVHTAYLHKCKQSAAARLFQPMALTGAGKCRGSKCKRARRQWVGWKTAISRPTVILESQSSSLVPWSIRTVRSASKAQWNMQYYLLSS